MSRAQRHQQSAQAARRLSAVAAGGRPPSAGAGWTPQAPAADDGIGWFGAPSSAPASQPSSVPPPQPSAVVGPVGSAAGSPWQRWRESAADRVPLALRGAAGVPAAALAAVLLVVLAVVGGVALRSASAGAQVVPVSRPLPVPTGSAAAPTSAAPAAGSAAGSVLSTATAPAGSEVPAGPGSPVGVVVVDVVGEVRRPGLVRLPPGSRVADAVAAAGGAGDDAVLTRINLARPLGDGEQVLVPDRDDEVPPAGPAPPVGGVVASPGVTSGPLDLNAATAADLDGLPGVGPVISGRIVAWRAEHGRFDAVDELAEVSGIGPTLLERLRPLVRV